jgi:hypothetical protein
LSRNIETPRTRAARKWGEPLEEQQCWVLLSTPKLTLALPTLRTLPPAPREEAKEEEQAARRKKRRPWSHVACVVGGTGVAPALQILRHVVAGAVSAFFVCIGSPCLR